MAIREWSVAAWVVLASGVARAAFDPCFDGGGNCPSVGKFTPSSNPAPRPNSSSGSSQSDGGRWRAADPPDGWELSKPDPFVEYTHAGVVKFDKGADAYARADYKGARDYFRDAQKLYFKAANRSRLAEADCALASSLYQLGLWHEAWTEYENGLANDPANRPCQVGHDGLAGELHHWRLITQPWATADAVKRALSRAGAKLTSACSDGSGDIVFDQYSVTIDQMPPGVSPEQVLAQLAQNMSGTVNSSEFNRINVFTKRNPYQPADVGDLYDIGLAFNEMDASVMLVEAAPSYFVFQTIKGKHFGSHPEAGSRAFGFWMHRDGSVEFYTIGASRPTSYGKRVVGGALQRRSWEDLVGGLARYVERRGGRAREQSLLEAKETVKPPPNCAR